jgi:hypothetical protein
MCQGTWRNQPILACQELSLFLALSMSRRSSIFLVSMLKRIPALKRILYD